MAKFNLQKLAMWLVVVGAIAWGVLGAVGTNIVTTIFGTGVIVDVIYIAVGISGLITGAKMLKLTK